MTRAKKLFTIVEKNNTHGKSIAPTKKLTAKEITTLIFNTSAQNPINPRYEHKEKIITPIIKATNPIYHQNIICTIEMPCIRYNSTVLWVIS